MYKITIKGEAQASCIDEDDNEIEVNLKDLNGIDCQDEFTEYFGEEQQSLIDKGVQNGYLQFEFKDGKLWSVNTYNSEQKLTKKELDILVDYTQGQWSDGIGEGFEQNECAHDSNENEIFVSPWFHGQKIEVSQEEVKESVNN